MKLENKIAPELFNIASQFTHNREIMFNSPIIETNIGGITVILYYKQGWFFASTEPIGILVIKDKVPVEKKLAVKYALKFLVFRLCTKDNMILQKNLKDISYEYLVSDLLESVIPKLDENNQIKHTLLMYAKHRKKQEEYQIQINNIIQSFLHISSKVNNQEMITEEIIDKIIDLNTNASRMIDLQAYNIIEGLKFGEIIEKNRKELNKFNETYQENLNYLYGTINGAKKTKQRFENQKRISDYRKYYEEHFLKNLDQLVRNK